MGGPYRALSWSRAVTDERVIFYAPRLEDKEVENVRLVSFDPQFKNGTNPYREVMPARLVV